MNSENNGCTTDDTSRDKGWKAEEGQGNLQHEACAPASGSDAEARDRLIIIENSAKEIKPFIIQEVKTTDEVTQEIYDRFPRMKSDALYLRIWNGRMGMIGRKPLEGDLPPDLFDLYVSLHLKKHPSFFNKN